jgi:hypothetical protein
MIGSAPRNIRTGKIHDACKLTVCTPLMLHTVVHEMAVIYEMADTSKKSDHGHLTLISESDLNKIKHRSEKKSKNKVSNMRIHTRL